MIAAVAKVVDHSRWRRDFVADPITTIAIHPIRSTEIICRAIPVSIC
jgi:hypothetical protein